MLDNKVFLQGINYLKANYINWQFDLNNDLMLKVWYKKFSNLETNVYMGMIEKFTEYNKFPPQSPADLMETLRTEITNQSLSANEAWQEVRRLIQQYGFYYGREKIYKALEIKGNEALTKTVEEYERELAGLTIDDTYTPERFKKSYEINLKRTVEKSSGVLLGTKITFLLE